MAFGIETLLIGILFGFVLAVPPGPMNAIIAEQSVRRGWIAGVRAGSGAMTADVIFFVLVWVGAAAILEEVGRLEAFLYLAGGVLMLIFAIDAVRAARNTVPYERATEDDITTGFRKTLLLGLTNPFQMAFWVTIGVAIVTPGVLDLGSYLPLVEALAVQTGTAALIGGFFAGIALWIVVYPAGLVAIGDRFAAFEPIVAALSGLALAGFGIAFVWFGLGGLL